MNEYLYKMDIPMTNNAVAISGFPEEIISWIWEEERRFKVTSTTTKRRI